MLQAQIMLVGTCEPWDVEGHHHEGSSNRGRVFMAHKHHLSLSLGWPTT